MKRIPLVLIFVTRAIWADCPEGSYSMTDADKKFYTDTVAVVKAALPTTPDGWRADDKNPNPYVPPSSICKGSEKEPLITGYYLQYVWVDGQKQRAAKLAELDKKAAAVSRTPMAGDQQKLMTELGTKDRDLRWQAKKLAPTDKAGSDKLYAEALVFAKQVAEIRNAHLASFKPELDALERERQEIFKSMPTELALYVLVNGSGVDLSDTNPVASIASAGVTQVGEKRTVLAYGSAWKKDGNSLRLGIQRGVPVQKIYAVSVEVKGDPQQAQMLLASLNGASVKSLLAK